jgi:hypothetical protein
VEAQNINWQRGAAGANETDAFFINFDAFLNSADGSPIPPEEAILGVLDLPVVQGNRTQVFLSDEYAWQAEPLDGSANFFANVDAMGFNGTFGPPGMGMLDVADCPATDAPTASPGLDGKFPASARTIFKGTHLGPEYGSFTSCLASLD